YLCMAFDDQTHMLATADGQAFTFSEYGYLRAGRAQPILRGELTAFRVKADMIAGDSVTVEGKPVTLSREGGFCSYGSLPKGLAAVPATPGAEKATEQAPA